MHQPRAIGESWTANGARCQGNAVVVIEDEGGCFLYQSIGCGADASLIITDSTPRDCGH